MLDYRPFVGNRAGNRRASAVLELRWFCYAGGTRVKKICSPPGKVKKKDVKADMRLYMLIGFRA